MSRFMLKTNGLYFFNKSVHCLLDHVLSASYRLNSSIDEEIPDPSAGPYRKSAIIEPKKTSAFEDSNLLRS